MYLLYADMNMDVKKKKHSLLSIIRGDEFMICCTKCSLKNKITFLRAYYYSKS